MRADKQEQPWEGFCFLKQNMDGILSYTQNAKVCRWNKKRGERERGQKGERWSDRLFTECFIHLLIDTENHGQAWASSQGTCT